MKVVIYIHVLPENKKEAMNKLKGVFSKSVQIQNKDSE